MSKETICLKYKEQLLSEIKEKEELIAKIDKVYDSLQGKDNKNACKHCENEEIFPSLAQSVRRRFKSSKAKIMCDFLRAKEDLGFAKLQEEKFCCDSAKYDAEDAYNKYFPYEGMANIESSIEELKKDIDRANELMKNITAEEFMELDCDTELSQTIGGLEYTGKKLNELFYDVQKALERETDPIKRRLLDGRK